MTADHGAGPLPLAMFPLGTVLFPHLVLPLHVFEPRYRALTLDCLAGSREFGVVLIERGTEVGGGDARFDVGTVARIVDQASTPDGRWALVTVGTRRTRVTCWLPDDPYPLALVEDLEEPPPTPQDLEALPAVRGQVRRALALAAELGEERVTAATFTLAEEPEVAVWQLCAISPLGPADQQVLLQAASASQRLALLASMTEAACEMLAYRLSGA